MSITELQATIYNAYSILDVESPRAMKRLDEDLHFDNIACRYDSQLRIDLGESIARLSDDLILRFTYQFQSLRLLERAF